MKSILKSRASSNHVAHKNLSDRTMESLRDAEEELEECGALQVSCEVEVEDTASIHGGDSGDKDEEAGGTAATVGPSPASPATSPDAAKNKKRIWFGGKVTAHVQVFDRKKPACHVSRFLVFRSRSSSSLIPSGREEGSDAPLTPTRWESGTSIGGRHLRGPARGGETDNRNQHSRGVRGTLMPFLPLRRRSSEETSSDDGSKGGRSGSGRMREAVAYVEDPSAALRRESLDARRNLATADDPDLSPKMPRRRGMVVTVDSPNVLKFTTPVNVSRDSPRQPVRRSSKKDEDDSSDGDCEHRDVSSTSGKAVDASAVKEIKFLDLDDSTSSNVDEDDMQALARTVQTMSSGPNPPGSFTRRWSSRRWSLSALPSMALTASSVTSHSASSSAEAPLQQPPPAPAVTLPTSSESGRRRWSLQAPGTDGVGSSKASKSRDGKRRWTWNSSKVPASS